MAESKERPWRVGDVADLDLSICKINVYSKLQTLTSTYETLPSRGHELRGGRRHEHGHMGHIGHSVAAPHM
jgi:hypothetical protein